MYKLLALDIDETITHDPVKPPEEIVRAVDRARAAGIHVTLATGRGFHGSECMVRQLRITEPVVNYGGAVVSDPVDGRVMYATEIPNNLIHAVLDDAEAHGIHAHIYQGDVVIHQKESPYVDAYVEILRLKKQMDPELRNKEWSNVPKVLMMTTEERAAEMIPYFQERYSGRLKVSGSSKGFIEFNHPMSHKGSGVEWVAGHLGIRREEVVCVGDNSLDMEMVKWAGLGCAVANAKEPLKEAADMVIPSCEEHGVAWLIDNVLLKG